MKRSEWENTTWMRSIVATLEHLTRYSSQVVILKSNGENESSLVHELCSKGIAIAESVAQVISLCETDNNSPAIVMEDDFPNEDALRTALVDLGAGLSRGGRVFMLLPPSNRGILGRLLTWAGLGSSRVRGFAVDEKMVRRVAADVCFEVVRCGRVGVSSCGLGYLSQLSKNWLGPLPCVRYASVGQVAVLRPRKKTTVPTSLSIIIPARNERGTLEHLLRRIPTFEGARVEVIFVEGHSTDGTWDAIQSLIKSYGGSMQIRAIQQSGSGKGDAVRLGLEHAQGDLVAILDADSTMPPEELLEFYEAYRRGDGDFLNGNRFHFRMERGAMRPLNKLGNIFFSRAVSFTLDCSLGDTLCGTKVFRRVDYDRMRRWRKDFGDLDPFGDFELLFPAAVLGLGISDVPVHYKARIYGATNIHRFRHGLQLLWMVCVALWRIKIGMPRRIHHGS